MRADKSRTRGHIVCPMNNKTSVSTPAVASAQPVNHAQLQPQLASRTLKLALDRFVADNPHALALVRVPTEAQERLRSERACAGSVRAENNAVSLVAILPR